MNQQPLNLRRSLQILRRHLTAVLLFTAAGLIAGAAYTILYPPMYTSSALVVLPASGNESTQAVIAVSRPVLEQALRGISRSISLQTLSSQVDVTNPISSVLSFDAQGISPAQAEGIANAVAGSYVSYVTASGRPGVPLAAQVFARAAEATEPSLPFQLLIAAGIGVIAGASIGAVSVLAVKSGDMRLWRRDDIADAIDVPVLASLPACKAADAAGWTKLLEDYEPSVADARRLRNALDHLGLVGLAKANSGLGGSSVTVFSLSSDPRALALGPQLALFAASRQIPTVLVIGAGQDTGGAATLRAACAAAPLPAKRSGQLRVAAPGHDGKDLPDAALTVVVAVVDSGNPHLADMVSTDTTVLAVSAGAATGKQLAGVAASAATEGHRISGILVADPERADPTTGRLPQVGRPLQMPIRMPGTAMVTRQ